MKRLKDMGSEQQRVRPIRQLVWPGTRHLPGRGTQQTTGAAKDRPPGTRLGRGPKGTGEWPRQAEMMAEGQG